MIIYIRHANDEEHNPDFKHDPHITKKGKRKIIKLTHKLIKKYGFPDKIFFSPFQRCTETAMTMINEIVFMQTGKRKNYCIKCYSYNIQMRTDNTLSRYFTDKDKLSPSVSPKTMKNKIPIYESKDKFSKRVHKHVSNIKNMEHNVTWCITHAITYKKIAKHFNISTPHRIDFLDHYVCANN